jgi:hypothetical protein
MIIKHIYKGCVNCPLVSELECNLLHKPIVLVEGFRDDCPLFKDDIIISNQHVELHADTDTISNELNNLN